MILFANECHLGVKTDKRPIHLHLIFEKSIRLRIQFVEPDFLNLIFKNQVRTDSLNDYPTFTCLQ